MFPTFSDGFGLTQLEAQASALPIIASGNCGNVVEDGRSGFLLQEITGKEIANRLDYLVANPLELARMSAFAAQRAAAYRLDCISHIWVNILT
jgi:glycosyltransferase involved in cell wall biosynthesis